MSDDQQELPEDPIVDPQLIFTDLRRKGMFLPFGLGESLRTGVMGSTNFEDKDLEEMLALVENANPDDLVTSGDDIWDAAREIKEIGDELGKRIDKVDWEGEFGDSFREWGRELSKNTLVLADFAKQAGYQLKAAGVGLRNVKEAMPDVDAATAAAPRLDAIPADERVETNEKYKLAKQKEEHRQEAINQMNRLASYYKVSHENMQGLEEPRFGPMPNIGMPPAPIKDTEPPSYPSKRPSDTAERHVTVEPLPQSVDREGRVDGSQPEVVRNAPIVPDGRIGPERDVRTDLNSVAPPLAPSADSAPRAQLPTQSGPGPTAPAPVAGPVPTYNGMGKNRVGAPPRATAPGPMAREGGVGRPGGASAVPPANGANNGMARPVTGGPGAGPVGKAPSATAPPVGQGNGIIGGTPQQSATTNSPRIPRGTVIGAEHGAMARPPVGATGAGAGAIGTGTGTGGASSGRRLASTPGGVVGAPGSTPAVGAASRPFTPGGTGLTKGAAGGNQAGMVPRPGTANPREQSREESRRPDYLTEDEETWATGRNGIAPPVVD
ncbi:hypothetical protein [Streptomyces megasporus]|uniref:hypothetical protein n=1 Tax=Streptomyces megasporus TaxID=44060 RepID=UPI00055AC67B|nr:hypothetical protein [Streptomyces megasporus]